MHSHAGLAGLWYLHSDWSNSFRSQKRCLQKRDSLSGTSGLGTMCSAVLAQKMGQLCTFDYKNILVVYQMTPWSDLKASGSFWDWRHKKCPVDHFCYDVGLPPIFWRKQRISWTKFNLELVSGTLGQEKLYFWSGCSQGRAKKLLHFLSLFFQAGLQTGLQWESCDSLNFVV